MIDRDLLWRAYPTGYLAARGTRTVQDWICIEASTDVVRWYNHFANEVLTLRGGDFFAGVIVEGPSQRAVGASGDLLPNVDPTDTATWACCLADLVNGAWPDDDPAMYDRVALRNLGVQDDMSCWKLVASFKSKKLGTYRGAEVFYAIEPTDDPALALVRIRIAQRKSDESLA